MAFGGYRDRYALGTPNNDTWVYLERILLASSQAPVPGQAVQLSWDARRDASRQYGLACSFQREPGIPTGDGRIIPLNPDALFVWSFLSQAAPFVGFYGVLDSLGQGTARILIPNDPRLTGVRFYVAGVTISAGFIATVSNEERITIQ